MRVSVCVCGRVGGEKCVLGASGTGGQARHCKHFPQYLLNGNKRLPHWRELEGAGERKGLAEETERLLHGVVGTRESIT